MPFPTMTRLLPLLMLAGLAAELASIILVGNLLGVGPTLLLLFGGGILGFALIRSAGLGIAAALRSPVQGSTLERGVAGKAVARVLAGLFFLIPGFLSDVFGLLLLLPPVRTWLGAKLPFASFSAGRPSSRRYETVIDAEAVEVVGEILPPEPRPRRDGQEGDGR
jgi:UPF0716 protein FxsA